MKSRGVSSVSEAVLNRKDDLAVQKKTDGDAFVARRGVQLVRYSRSDRALCSYALWPEDPRLSESENDSVEKQRRTVGK